MSTPDNEITDYLGTISKSALSDLQTLVTLVVTGASVVNEYCVSVHSFVRDFY